MLTEVTEVLSAGEWTTDMGFQTLSILLGTVFLARGTHVYKPAQAMIKNPDECYLILNTSVGLRVLSMREALGSISSTTDKNKDNKIPCICLDMVGLLLMYWKEVIKTNFLWLNHW